MVVKLEERTLVVVDLADIAELALVEDVGVNTVKETTQTQLNTPPLEDTKDCLVGCSGVVLEMGIY